MPRSAPTFWFAAALIILCAVGLAVLLSAYTPRHWVHLTNAALAIPAACLAFALCRRVGVVLTASATLAFLGIATHTGFYGLWQILGRSPIAYPTLVPNTAGVLMAMASASFLAAFLWPGRRGE
jgi:hypothetical protein